VAVLVFNAAFGFLQQGQATAVDLNADHLAACVLDSSGNPLGDPTTVAVDTAGLAAERRDGRLRAAITALLDHAEAHNCARSRWKASTSLMPAPCTSGTADACTSGTRCSAPPSGT
jgi:hypothetical protein